MQSVVAALGAVLLAASPALAWSQLGGDAAHSGLGTFTEHPLDVVGNVTLVPKGATMAVDGDAGVVTSGQMIYTMFRLGGKCMLAEIDATGRAPREIANLLCAGEARLAGLDSAGSRLIVCVDGSAADPILQAYSVTGSKLWAVSPSLQDGVPALPVPGAPSTDTWSCRGLAIGNGIAYVPFSSSGGRNRVEAVRLSDGSSAWATSIPATAFTQGNSSAVPAQLLDLVGGFIAETATLAESGLVVTGHRTGTSATGAPPGLAWLDLNGKLVGALSPAPSASTSASQAATFQPASSHPAANRDRVAHLMGDTLYIVNPNSRQVAPIVVGPASLGATVLAPICWSRDVILVPTEGSALLLSTSDPNQPARQWGSMAQASVQAAILGTRAAWVAVTVEDVNGTEAYLLRIGLLAARTEQRLPLPFHPAAGARLHITPLGEDSVLAWDDGGRGSLVRANPLAALPKVVAGGLYPAPGEPASIEVQAPAGTLDLPNTTLLVAWGDGLVEEAHDGDAPSHAYESAGERQVIVTAVAKNGTTSSAAIVLHVGSSPPPRKGFLQSAFAPENQNYTFFTIGILLTVGGSVFAAIGLHRGRHRLDRHLGALDRIRDQGRREPFKAVRDLHEFREARRIDLTKGNLEDAQFTIIEASATQVLGLLRQRILGVFTGRVSDRFSGALDLALADGAIDEGEGVGLIAQAERENDLTPQERSTLSNLVKSWQRVMAV